MATIRADQMSETLYGVLTRREPLQLGEDVPGQVTPAFLQGPEQLRESLADDAMQQVVMRAAQFGAWGGP